MLVMDVSSPRVVFSLPSLVFGEILGGLLESPESPLAANHIPGETEDGNAFILQKTVSPRMKFITTPLHCIGYVGRILQLKRCQSSDASDQRHLLVFPRRGCLQEDINESLFF